MEGRPHYDVSTGIPADTGRAAGKLWFPAACIAVALLAPVATYVAASRPQAGSPAPETALPPARYTGGEASGDLYWACVLARDPRLPPIDRLQPGTELLAAWPVPVPRTRMAQVPQTPRVRYPLIAVGRTAGAVITG